MALDGDRGTVSREQLSVQQRRDVPEEAAQSTQTSGIVGSGLVRVSSRAGAWREVRRH